MCVHSSCNCQFGVCVVAYKFGFFGKFVEGLYSVDKTIRESKDVKQPFSSGFCLLQFAC